MSSLGFPRAALSTIKSSHSVPNRPLPTTTQTAPATKSHGPHPVLPMPAWAANRLSGNGAVVRDDQNLPYKPLTNVIFVYITWWWPWVRRGEVSRTLVHMQTLAFDQLKTPIVYDFADFECSSGCYKSLFSKKRSAKNYKSQAFFGVVLKIIPLNLNRNCFQGR